MFKKFFISLLSCLCCMGLITPVYASDTLDLDIPYVYVYSPKYNQVLYSNNEYETMLPASLTKMMTVLVAIENIDDLDAEAEIKTEYLAYAIEEHASVAGFEEHEMATAKDLLYGAMLKSGAEACIALVDLACGSEEKFVEKMNEKAEEIGMTGTHFKNVTGLNATDHYSTAYDLALLTDYALNNSLFKTIYTASTYTTVNGKHKFKSFKESRKNKEGFDTSNIIGSKTGFTDEALYCISALVKCGDEELIVVIGKDSSRESYTQHINEIVEYFNGSYESRTLTHYAKKLGTVKINRFFFSTYRARVLTNISAYVKKTTGELRYEFVQIEDLESIEKGDHIADIKVYDEKELVSTIPYYAPYSLMTSYLVEGGIILIIILLFILICLLLLILARKIYRKHRRKKRAKLRKKKARK